MNKEKRVIFLLVIVALVSIAIIVVVGLKNKNGKGGFDKYQENETVYVEYDETYVPETDWYIQGFSGDKLADYKTYAIVDINYDVDKLLSEAPEWLKSKYQLYPDDAKMILDTFYIMNNAGYRTFEESDNYAYYQFEGTTSIVVNVDDEDTCFVFDSEKCYYYKLKDEIKPVSR